MDSHASSSIASVTGVIPPPSVPCVYSCESESSSASKKYASISRAFLLGSILRTISVEARVGEHACLGRASLLGRLHLMAALTCQRGLEGEAELEVLRGLDLLHPARTWGEGGNGLYRSVL